MDNRSDFKGNKADKLEPKRRRVTRACDTCRLKKVKCDGKQPCIHCTVYSYSCTYDQPTIRNKNKSGIPVPSRPMIYSDDIRPNNSPRNSDTSVLLQNLMNLLFPKLRANVLDDHPLNFDFDRFQKVVHTLQSKGLVNLHDISEHYLDANSKTPPNSPGHEYGSVSSEDINSIGREIKIDLPSKKVALQLIHTCWDKACVLLRFYHRPSLLEEVDLLYSLDPLNFTDRQQKFLPFLYSILACGSLFSRLSEINSEDNEALEDDGFKYFLEGRKLIDITNVGDIISIQTIVMMIIYLQCSARLSTCYSYIGIALRSALKEGLHRDLSVFQGSRRELDPIEVDTRKRVFYTIYKMDIYINSLLGLPRSLHDDEFDQTLPEELDDENITREGSNFEAQQGRLSSSACANHHTKLMIIMSHIVRDLYPIKIRKLQSSNSSPNSSSGSPETQTPNYMHKKVSVLEFELKAWLDQLPPELKPTDPNYMNVTEAIPKKFLLANYYLHLAFLNCQIMLYRPFIHFISHGNDSRAKDPRSLIRGRNCIKVARSVVKLANKMIDQNLLIGTYWFSMYTIFFSIACLIYYYHFVHNSHHGSDYNSQTNYAGVLFDDDLNLDMIKKDIEIGKKVLDTLKDNSNASLRIYNILNKLFEQLNRRTASASKDISQLLQSSPRSMISNSQIKNTMLTFDLINNFSNLPMHMPGDDDGDLSSQLENRRSLQNDLFRSDLDGRLHEQDPLNVRGKYSPYPMRQSQSQPATNVSGSSQLQNHGQTSAQDRIQAEAQAFSLPPMNSTDSDPLSAPPSSNADMLSNSRPMDNNEPSVKPENAEQEMFQRIQDLNTGIDMGGQDAIQAFDDLSKGQEPAATNESNSYIPGIIDKFDSQIFGRMLPPYMLEGQTRNVDPKPDDINFDSISDLIDPNFGSPSIDYSNDHFSQL